MTFVWSSNTLKQNSSMVNRVIVEKNSRNFKQMCLDREEVRSASEFLT